MANNADSSKQSNKQDYPILKPFRLNGKWHYKEEKTISLSPKQAEFLLLNCKVGEPLGAKNTKPKAKETK